MSLAGSVGAVAGAMLVLGAAWWSATGRPELVAGVTVGLASALVIGGALAGCLLDSLLGGTLQARYRAGDGTWTERSAEAGVPLPLAAGVRWMNNDRVNIACTLIGAAVPFARLV
jgi:uncharacterized membrane protein